jgi:acetylornithine deacetylase
MAPSTTDILAALVGFDTTSRNSNLALIGWVSAYLDGHGVPYRISLDATGLKANLHATIGPPAAGGVALSGHVDTVPVDGQAWTTDPFALARRGGRLQGRGATDMKGFVACALAAVPGLLAAGLRRPVHLLLSYDEEVGCLGAQRLVQDLDAGGLRPALCIVGEPTLMQPVLAHKGRLAARVEVRGRSGHSSDPARGVNAVHAAAEAVAWLAGEARRMAAEGPFETGFDPPHSTVHVGVMQGGTSLNMIPERASFEVEYRGIPATDRDAELDRLRTHAAAVIEPAMRAVDPAAGFTATVLNDVPALSLDPSHELAGLVRQLTGSNSTGKVSYGTEAGVFQAAGIPSIVCGPGDIAQAHQPDEWIAESELAACDGFIRRLAARLAA